jgi:hypothetical protein
MVADTWLQESHSHKQHVLQPLAAVIIIITSQSHPPSQLRAFTALPALLAATGRSSCSAPQEPCLTLPQVAGH